MFTGNITKKELHSMSTCQPNIQKYAPLRNTISFTRTEKRWFKAISYRWQALGGKDDFWIKACCFRRSSNIKACWKHEECKRYFSKLSIRNCIEPSIVWRNYLTMTSQIQSLISLKKIDVTKSTWCVEDDLSLYH